ncbi:MAG: hypothetical protein O9322_06280 [Beijerinckiaceae bacterium]|nr:hypothetical protein [Beijerinckiaceae bacterium]MCZ8299130.1 hypothetical protein [Beijerinckiaceae bacterium]
MIRPALASLRHAMAVLACMLLLLGGVAQQRAFATKLGTAGNPGAMAMCLPGAVAPDGMELPPAPLHDCFECCLGTLPGLALQSVSAVEHLLPVGSALLPPDWTNPLPGPIARPCSRGPPGYA